VLSKTNTQTGSLRPGALLPAPKSRAHGAPGESNLLSHRVSAQEYFLMFLCHLANWFLRPPEDAPAEDRRRVVAPALPARRPSAPAPAVEVAVSPQADGLVIQVKGEANVQSAGALMDGLLRPTARRPLIVILDLSELRSISCLAMGVL